MAAGSIVVDLLMKTGSFETDTARAGKALEKFTKNAQRDAAATAAAFKGSFAGNLLSDVVQKIGSALGRLPFEALAAVDAFNDLKDATGASIEGISAIDRVARETGVGFATVETSLVKLNQALNSAKPDSDVARALQGIGLSAEELKRIDPAEALRRVAVALSGYADDGNKARLVQELFGKSLKEVAPLLVDLATKGTLVASTTEEQAKQVEEYRKASFKLRADIEDLARTFTISLIPAISEATGKLRELFGGPKSATNLKAEVSLLEGAIKDLEKKAGSGDGLLNRFMNGSEAVRTEKLARFRKDLADVRGQLLDKTVPNPFEAYGIGVVPPSIKMPDKRTGVRSVRSGGGPKDDPTKKLFENQIKEIDALVQKEQEVFAGRNRMLDLVNSQSLLSVQSYYDAKQAILDSAVIGQKAAIDEEIALSKRFRDAPGRSERDKADTQGKINELIRERAQIEDQASERSLELDIKKQKSLEEVANAYRSISADVLDLQGNLTAASEIRFDLQFDALKKTFTAEGNAAGLQAVETLRAAAIAQAAFQKASIDSGRTVNALSRAEDYLALAEKQGSIGSIEALTKLGEIRKSMIPIMEAQVRAQEAIAAASENPALIENAERARLELEKLKETLDPLADKFNDLFRTSAGNAIGDFLNQTKSAKDAIKDFGRSISTEINNMIGREFSDKLFGKEGIFGGAGGFMSDLFGGKKDPLALQTAGINSSLTTLQTSGIDPTITALQRMQQAIDGAAGSLSGGQAQSGETAILDLFKETDDASKATADFGKTAASAATDIARMAASASRGGSALGLLPSIISALGGGAGGGSSGWLGAIASAASSYFGGGSSVGFDGYRASGGPVMAGQTYLVGERGPERLTMGNQNGRITPNDKMGQRPIVVNVTATPNMSRQTAMQQGSTIGRAIRATARVD